MKKSIGLNAILNVLKSLLSILFPLLSYPYAFRILHSAGIGKVNYASSIVSYFSLIAAFGISTYAIREGARLKRKRNELENFASQVYSINILTTVFSFALLAIAVFAFPNLKQYLLLICILSTSIVFNTLGIDWVNTIFEDYFFITVRSLCIQIISLLLLFLLVKDEHDYYIYAGLTAFSNGLICLFNRFYCRRYINLKFTLKFELGRHIKPIALLFANSVATIIYGNSDMVMIGYFLNDSSVGLYTLAVKINTVFKTILASIYAVAIPRLAFYYGEKEMYKYKELFSQLCSCLSLLLIPCTIGLICFADKIVLIMGGPEYIESTTSLKILSLSLLGAIYGGLFTYCLNVTTKNEKNNAKATAVSALINIILNLFFIPHFGINGAALTTVISEFYVFIYVAKKTKDKRRYIDIRMCIRNFMCGCVGGFIVCLTNAVFSFVANIYLNMMAVVLFSLFFYLLVLILIKNELVLFYLTKIIRRNGK